MKFSFGTGSLPRTPHSSKHVFPADLAIVGLWRGQKLLDFEGVTLLGSGTKLEFARISEFVVQFKTHNFRLTQNERLRLKGPVA